MILSIASGALSVEGCAHVRRRATAIEEENHDSEHLYLLRFIVAMINDVGVS